MTNSLKLSPLWDRLIIRWIRNEKTSGGLHIPEMAQSNSPLERGEILEAGDGLIMPTGIVRPMKVKVGDVILFAKPAAQKLTFPYKGWPANDIWMIREENVIGVVTGLDVADEPTSILGPGGRRLGVLPTDKQEPS